MKQKRTPIGLIDTTYDKEDYEKAVAYEIRFKEIVYTDEWEPYVECCENSTWKYTSGQVQEPRNLILTKSEWGKRNYASIDCGGYAVSREVRDKLIQEGLAEEADFTAIPNKKGDEICFHITPVHSFEGFAEDNEAVLVDQCSSCGLKRYNPIDEPYILKDETARKLQGLNCTKEHFGPIIEDYEKKILERLGNGQNVVGGLGSFPMYIVNKEVYVFLKKDYPRMHFVPIFGEEMKRKLAEDKKKQQDAYWEMVRKLSRKQAYVVDYLPMDVPEDAVTSYGDVSYYILNEKKTELKNRFVAVIHKLMCYYKMCLGWGEWEEYPDPAKIDEIMEEIMEDFSGTMYCLFPDIRMLIEASFDSLWLDVYNPSKEVQILLDKIAASEGMFFRKKAK
ncbi:hypothetical protein SAMN02910358_02461 [Lachnospiraceae bacterium XBB1006]|nr:hypothetical protein SAMN02910358_02461 [Lachnospiraceae bacterium XBB1006]